MQEDREYIITHMSDRELEDFLSIGGKPIVVSGEGERRKWTKRPERTVYAKTLRPVHDAAA